jgi:hypothetical protein
MRTRDSLSKLPHPQDLGRKPEASMEMEQEVIKKARKMILDSSATLADR